MQIPRAAQGIDPEARTFNTVIIACNMSSQACEALRVYERMLAAGAQPTATTFTALIRCGGRGSSAWGCSTKGFGMSSEGPIATPRLRAWG